MRQIRSWSFIEISIQKAHRVKQKNNSQQYIFCPIDPLLAVIHHSQCADWVPQSQYKQVLVLVQITHLVRFSTDHVLAALLSFVRETLTLGETFVSWLREGSSECRSRSMRSRTVSKNECFMACRAVHRSS